MVAKVRIWIHTDRGLIRRIMVMYLLLARLLIFQEDGLTVNAETLSPNDGKHYLDQKESEVKWIAGNASLNNAICGSLSGCSAACSRVACNPVSDFQKSLQCNTVDNNEYYALCPRGACQNKMLVDYSRSFVRLPAPASTNLQPEVARDICLQRMLDSTFKNVSFPSNYSYVYFGSTSGVFRAFPGREQNDLQCTSYDPRWRPWFLNGISVSRDVKILVDVAHSMGNAVTADYNGSPGTTYLDVMKNITLALLQTFQPGDYVEVISFDSGTAASLGDAFVVNSSYNYFDPSGHPELAALVTSVNNIAASSVAGAASDVNSAIRLAANSFNQIQSLKVIIVLSNGLFVVNSTTFPAADLQKRQAKLMVYKLPTNDDGGDQFLLMTSLQSDICSVKGSFELLDPLATTNPLYSVRSYFTYLAGVQLSAVGGNVTWSNKFASATQNLNAVTPTYPAFGSDGQLIGVAGIDVIVDKLAQPLQNLVLQDFKSRKRGTLLAPAIIPMTCYYQNTSANLICLGSTLPDSSAICTRTDMSSSLAERTCCGACGWSNNHHPLEAWKIILIIIVVVVVTVLLVGYCYWKKRQQNSRDPVGNIPDYSGNED